MTAASPGPSGPNIFSLTSAESAAIYRVRKESFAFSLLGQAAILGILIYFTGCVIRTTPGIDKLPMTLRELPVFFSGHSGGGGGNFDKLPASHGALPRASLEDQIVAPTVKLPTEIPKLAVDPTVAVAPEVKIPQGNKWAIRYGNFPACCRTAPEVRAVSVAAAATV